MSISTCPRRGLLRFTTTACAAALALTGCAGGEPSAAPAVPAPAPAPAAVTALAAATAPAAIPAPAVTVVDPWVKTAEAGMTAVFGTFSTTGSAPVTVVSAQTSASPRTELHEVLTGADGSTIMRPKNDGFVIEPGTPRLLAPGGDHIMIMDLTSPIRPGDQVEVTLTLSDGSTISFTALAKETSGGEENYEGGAGDMSGGQHG
jgi:copper(I)-binding protein